MIYKLHNIARRNGKIFLSFMIGMILLFSCGMGQPICPDQTGATAPTENGEGNSSYIDLRLRSDFKMIEKFRKIRVDQPILDVGAGYGVY